MFKYLDEDDYNKLRILYYLENHYLTTVLFEELMKELDLNNYQIKKLLSEIQEEIRMWDLEGYYILDVQTQKSWVRYERRTQSNIGVFVEQYAKQARMEALIQAVFTEEVTKISDLEDRVFLSKSATYKLLKKFSDLSEEYNLSIGKKLKFEGEEWMIREFIYTFYHSLYGNFHQNFSPEIESELAQLIEALKAIPGLFPRPLSQSEETKLFYRLFVIYVRHYLEHFTLAKSFMRLESPFLSDIQTLFAQALEKSEEDHNILEESYEFLYFLASEGLIDSPLIALPQTAKSATEQFKEAFISKFPAHAQEINAPETQGELNNIHLRLLVSLRTNFDLSILSNFTFMEENYQELEEFCFSFARKLTGDLAGHFKEKTTPLAHEYLFLLLTHTNVLKALDPIKICIDFSYGESYNHYISKNIQSLGVLNLEIVIGNMEGADIYLSNVAVPSIDAEQIIWASPPSSYDWEFFGNIVVEIRKEKSKV